MKKGDLLIPSETSKWEAIGYKLKNCVCIKKPDEYGIITVEHDGIRKPDKRYRSRYSKVFFTVVK